MWTVFKVFIEFLTGFLLVYVLVFLALRHLSSPTRDLTILSALEGKVLTPGPPREVP